MKRLHRVLALGVAALTNACGGDFDPGSRITDLRVLAVRADAPYAAPEQTVHLEALVTDPKERAITWGWGICVNPTSFSVLGCIDAFDASSFTMGAGESAHDVTIPADAIASLPAVGQPRASVGAIVVACPGELSLASGALPFRCADVASGRVLGTDEYVVGMKRIFARSTDRNENPVIAQVTWDGAEWPPSEIKDVQPCSAAGNDYAECDGPALHEITVAVPQTSIESGVDSFGLSFREQVVVQYYATEGIFEHDVRLAADSATGWAARRQSAGQIVTMWFVVRDDRGGVTWEERRVRVGAS